MLLDIRELCPRLEGDTCSPVASLQTMTRQGPRTEYMEWKNLLHDSTRHAVACCCVSYEKGPGSTECVHDSTGQAVSACCVCMLWCEL